MPKIAIPFGAVVGIITFLAISSIVGEKGIDKLLEWLIVVGIGTIYCAIVAIILFLAVIFFGAIFFPPPKKR